MVNFFNLVPFTGASSNPINWPNPIKTTSPIPDFPFSPDEDDIEARVRQIMQKTFN